ncbi:hypothetical protein B0H14DRAFT_2615413 [Mycena olivaceomarginata]|nr:hypothetical protein B0H14DRAFT_2615413 [Mycena olivaceomarginata]
MLAGCPCFRKGDDSVFSGLFSPRVQDGVVDRFQDVRPKAISSSGSSPFEANECGVVLRGVRNRRMHAGAESHGEQAGRLHHVPAWVSMDTGRRAEGGPAPKMDGGKSPARHSRVRYAAQQVRSLRLACAPGLRRPSPQGPSTTHPRKTSIRYALYYSEDVKDYSDSDDARLKTEADSTLTSSATERGPDGYGRCPRPTEAGLGGRQAPPRFRPGFRRLCRFTTDSCKQLHHDFGLNSDQASDERMAGWTTGSTDDSEPSDGFRSDGTTPPIPPRRGLPHDSDLSDHHDATARRRTPSFLLFFSFPYFRLASRAAYRHRAVPHCQQLGIWRRKQNKPEDCTDDAMRCDALRYAAAAFSFSFPIAGPYRRPCTQKEECKYALSIYRYRAEHDALMQAGIYRALESTFASM